MNWSKNKEHISKLNLILSLVGVLLILIPFILIYFADFFSERDPEMTILIGTILIACSIPMILIVAVLYIGLIISSMLMIGQKVCLTRNIIALLISVVCIIICSIGTYHYFVTGAGLVDTILRMG